MPQNTDKCIPIRMVSCPRTLQSSHFRMLQFLGPDWIKEDQVGVVVGQ